MNDYRQNIDNNKPSYRPCPGKNRANLGIENSEKERHDQCSNAHPSENQNRNFFNFLPPDQEDQHRFQDMVNKWEGTGKH